MTSIVCRGNDQSRDGKEIERETREPPERRETLPFPVKPRRDVHWNTFRAQPERISAIMIRLTMAIRMASTTSKSNR